MELEFGSFDQYSKLLYMINDREGFGDVLAEGRHAASKLNDPDGDTGPFLILMLADEAAALRAADGLKDAGLHNVFRIADYGLHIYFNIPSLVGKAPLSPAGNPWSLEANSQSVYDYNKGACPTSDALFARSVLVPIPSRLNEQQEKFAAEAIRGAVKP